MTQDKRSRYYSEDFCFYMSRYVCGVRNLLGWSQEELAQKSGYSRVTIARVETGVVPISKFLLAELVDLFNKHGVVCQDLNSYLLGISSHFVSMKVSIDLDLLRQTKGN